MSTAPLPTPVLADILVNEGGLPFMYRVRLYAVTVVAEEEGEPDGDV